MSKLAPPYGSAFRSDSGALAHGSSVGALSIRSKGCSSHTGDLLLWKTRGQVTCVVMLSGFFAVKDLCTLRNHFRRQQVQRSLAAESCGSGWQPGRGGSSDRFCRGLCTWVTDSWLGVPCFARKRDHAITQKLFRLHHGESIEDSIHRYHEQPHSPHAAAQEGNWLSLRVEVQS
jgi:hypothetical protein